MQRLDAPLPPVDMLDSIVTDLNADLPGEYLKEGNKGRVLDMIGRLVEDVWNA